MLLVPFLIALRPAGWTEGTPAANRDQALAPMKPLEVELPDFVAKHIAGPTALLYFSRTCPHCQRAMPEFNKVARTGEIAFLGVAMSMATDRQIESLAKKYQPPFPLVKDQGGAFARAVGARSTPSVFLVRPRTQDKAAAGAAADAGRGSRKGASEQSKSRHRPDGDVRGRCALRPGRGRRAAHAPPPGAPLPGLPRATRAIPFALRAT